MPPKLRLLLDLLKRVKRLASYPGARAELARAIGVTRGAVTHYLAGRDIPGGEVTLRLLQWVAAREAQMKKDSGSVGAPPELLTQPKKARSNAKPKSGRKKR